MYLTLVFIPPTEYLYKHEANTGASKGRRQTLAILTSHKNNRGAGEALALAA